MGETIRRIWSSSRFTTGGIIWENSIPEESSDRRLKYKEIAEREGGGI